VCPAAWLGWRQNGRRVDSHFKVAVLRNTV
jgi:hypothetical protein